MPITPNTHQLYLSTELGEQKGIVKAFNNADSDLTDDSPGGLPNFLSVTVKSGSWILYSGKRYNDDRKGHIQIVEKGTEYLDFQPLSLRPIPCIPNSVTLFEHPNYGGTMVSTTTNRPSLKEFLIFNDAGVSSIIIEPMHSWKFFTGTDYSDPSFILPYGRYKNSSKFYCLNDRIQSVKRI